MKKFFQRFISSIFNQGKPDSFSRAVVSAGLVILFLLGILHWLFFFRVGEISFRAQDWPKEYKYYSVIQQSLQSGVIPYHVTESFQETNRFLGLPETVLSPQVVLLKYLTIGQFVNFNVILLYCVGFIGCLLIRKRYQLSLISFSVFFFIFNLNGHIISHIAAGHSMWLGYFFLPFFMLYSYEILEGKCQTVTAIKLAFVLFFMMLQGSLHIVIWCLIFMALLMVLNLKSWKPFIIAAIGAGLMSAFRIFPAIITFWDKSNYHFDSGYISLVNLLDGLTVIHNSTYWPAGLSSGWWEYDIYIDILGLAVLLFFGVYLSIKGKILKNRVWDFAMLIMALLSMNKIYGIVAHLPLPLFNAERVSSRFMIIPLIALLFIAVIRMEKAMHKVKSFTVKWFSVAGVILMASALVVHSNLWKIRELDKTAPAIVNLNIEIFQFIDPFYISIVQISWLISILAVIAFAVWYVRAVAKCEK